MVGGWLLLAGLAVTRRQFPAAILAAAAPLLLTSYYGLFSAFFGLVAARVLVVAGVVALLSADGRDGRLFLGTALAAFGVMLDFSSALLAAPVFAYCALTCRRGSQVLAGALGLLPAAAWIAFTRHFYVSHPDYALHPAPGFAPELTALGSSLSHPARLWSMYAPELLHSWIAPVAAFACVVGLLVATGRLQYAVPGLVAAAAVVFAIASPRALDDRSPLLPSARILLAAPLTIWVLTYLFSMSRTENASVPELNTSPNRVLGGLLVAVVVASATVHVVTMNGRTEDLERAANAAPFRYPLVKTDVMHERCRYMDALVAQTGIRLVVSTGDRPAAYACGAFAYGRYITLAPEYERRTWLLRAESETQRSAMMVWNVDRNWCDKVGRRAFIESCRIALRAQQVPVAIVHFRPRAVVPMLVELGFHVRPFGPQCHPQRPVHCLGSRD
jgi:hypothetical protein